MQQILGTNSALERTCALQARLRQALQDLQPLSRNMDVSEEAAGAERDALITIVELLELLEDRLREYRLIDPYDNDTKAINARNMEQTRRELLEVATVNLPRVAFTKEAIKEVIAFADVHENLPSGTREGYTLRADASLGAPLSSSHANPHPALATKYPPQPSREEKKKAPLMSHHPNTTTDDRFSSSTRGSVEDSIPAVYPSRSRGMDEDGDTAMSSMLQHHRAQHPISPRGALTHAAASSASLPARLRSGDGNTAGHHHVQNHHHGHHQPNNNHAPRPPMPTLSPRGLPGAAPPPLPPRGVSPSGVTDLQSEGPTRSEFEEAERVIAQFTKPRKLPGSSAHNWMGPLLPVEDATTGRGTLNSNSLYQLDPDYGGKLRVSASTLLPQHATAAVDHHNAMTHADQQRGTVVRPSLYRAPSPERSIAQDEVSHAHRARVVHGPPHVVGIDTAIHYTPITTPHTSGLLSTVTGAMVKTVVGAVVGAAKLAAVGAAVWVGVAGAGHAARWVGALRPRGVRTARRTRAASAGLEGQQRRGVMVRGGRASEEEPASNAMQWLLEHGTPPVRAGGVPARRVVTPPRRALPRMQEEGWLHWPHALEVSPCFEEALQRPRVPVCPPPGLGTARG